MSLKNTNEYYQAFNSVNLCTNKINELKDKLNIFCDKSKIICPQTIYDPKTKTNIKVTGQIKLPNCQDITCMLDQANIQNNVYKQNLNDLKWKGISQQGSITEMTLNDLDELSKHINERCQSQINLIDNEINSRFLNISWYQKLWIWIKKWWWLILIIIIIIFTILIFTGSIIIGGTGIGLGLGLGLN